MSETSPPPVPTLPPVPAASSGPLPAPIPPTRSATQRAFGCIGRLLSAVLVIVITSVVALAAITYGAMTFGYTAATPGQLSNAQVRVATLEASNLVFATQNVLFQTQIAQMSRQSGSDREQVDALKEQVASFSEISNEVATQLAADTQERATLVADIRSSRDAVAVFATSEAGRAALLTELNRRSERVERFLQRLSDISQDTALDLQSTTATSLPLTATVIAPTATIAATPTAIPSPTSVPNPSPTLRVTATLAATIRPSATPAVATPTSQP